MTQVRDLDFLTQQINALDEERNVLEEERQKLIQEQKKEKIKFVRAICTQFGITADEVFKERKPRQSGSQGDVERPITMPRPSNNTPKYRNPITQATWAGIGRRPNWMPVNKADWDKYLLR